MAKLSIKSTVKCVLTAFTALLCSAAAQASPITVSFSFDQAAGGAIAEGSLVYDSSKDGSVIGFGDLSSFSLQFFGLSSGSYDLAFVMSGNDAFKWLGFDSSTDTFVTTVIGIPVTLEDVKNFVGGGGFFARDDLKLIRDYSTSTSSVQQYANLTISVDRPGVVPEPSMLALVGVGLVGAAGLSRRRLA